MNRAPDKTLPNWVSFNLSSANLRTSITKGENPAGLQGRFLAHSGQAKSGVQQSVAYAHVCILLRAYIENHSPEEIETLPHVA